MSPIPDSRFPISRFFLLSPSPYAAEKGLEPPREITHRRPFLNHRHDAGSRSSSSSAEFRWYNVCASSCNSTPNPLPR